MKPRSIFAGWVLSFCLAAYGQTEAGADAKAATLDQGLLLYYPFDQDDGAVVRDASGGGRTGEVDGATWVAQGARGGAYRFDSTQQCILADDAGLPQGDAPRTMSVWIKLNVLYPEMTTGLLTYGTHRWNQMSGVGMDWRNGRDQYYFTQHGGVALTRRKLTVPGQWHHLAYTYEGNGRHHLYVDGELTDGMSELRGPLDTVCSGVLFIGGHPGSVGPNGGYLDEIRISGRALSAQEVKELAAAKAPEAPSAMPPPPAPAPIPATTDLAKTEPGANGGQAIASAAPEPGKGPVIQQFEKGPEPVETMVLQWASVPGRAYEVQWTDDLTKGFTVIASNLVATATEQSYTNVMGGARAAFYRVKIQE
jgi:hypothetical protein